MPRRRGRFAVGRVERCVGGERGTPRGVERRSIAGSSVVPTPERSGLAPAAAANGKAAPAPPAAGREAAAERPCRSAISASKASASVTSSAFLAASAIVAGVRTAWETNFMGIRDAVTEVVGVLSVSFLFPPIRDQV